MTSLKCLLGWHKIDRYDPWVNWQDYDGFPHYLCIRCKKEAALGGYYVSSIEGFAAPYDPNWTQEEADQAWMSYYNLTLHPDDKIRTPEELHARHLGVRIKKKVKI